MKGEYPSPPTRDPRALSDPDAAVQNLLLLADVFDLSADEVPDRLKSFKVSIAGTTQRIRSRSVRFLRLYEALLPEPV